MGAHSMPVQTIIHQVTEKLPNPIAQPILDHVGFDRRAAFLQLVDAPRREWDHFPHRRKQRQDRPGPIGGPVR